MTVHLFDNWRYQQANLFRTNTREDDYAPVNVAEAASRAVEQLDIDAPDINGRVVPLFAEHEPIPTNTYVIYRPDQEQIGWFDRGFGVSGAERFTDAHRLNTTVIGHRLRFWLPEHQPEMIELDESELPPETIRPKDRLSQGEYEAFFNDMREFVQTERRQQRERNWQEYNDLGLDGAIRRNKVTSPFLQIGRIKYEGESAYRFQVVKDEDEEDDDEVDLRDDESLFEGNYCIVDTHANDAHFPIPVKILSIDGPGVTFRPEWRHIDSRAPVENTLNRNELEIRFHELLNPVPFQRRLDAIKQVKKNNKKRQLLTGRRSVKFPANKRTPAVEVELNDYQRKALVWADGAEDVVCIHGPPGTGKTRTLTAYVRLAVAKGHSVLVTAHSNQAVDNLLVGDSTPREPEEDTLHAMAQDPDQDFSIARVGSNSRNSVIQSNYINNPTGRADVVAATTSGAAQFDQDMFDVAVLDEATQASRPATAIVLNCAEKLILAGDHKQLPPYCADENMQEEEMHISLFEYLLNRYDDKISVLLRRQYRMHEEIAAYPNDAFYNGNLETADRNRRWTISDLKPLMGVDIEGEERRDPYGKSYYNMEEAEAVAKQVKLLVMNGVAPSDIGVISAYSGQKRKIIDHVNQLDIDNTRRVSIDTVDSFQGGEREAIIVSFVRSNEDGHSGFLEFPEEGPRRLNVALTRARKRLVLVGNWETLGQLAPHRAPEESCAELYAQLSEHLSDRNRMKSLREQQTRSE